MFAKKSPEVKKLYTYELQEVVFKDLLFDFCDIYFNFRDETSIKRLNFLYKELENIYKNPQNNDFEQKVVKKIVSEYHSIFQEKVDKVIFKNIDDTTKNYIFYFK